MKKFIPLVVFVVFLIFLYNGLGKDTKKIPSPFIDKKFPNIVMVDYKNGKTSLIRTNFKDGWTLVNFWASWCTTCRVEHHMLMKISKGNKVKMLGVNYKDTKEDSSKFLSSYGNPFDIIAFDKKGSIGLNLGIYAMPESFLVDNRGIIRHKYLGEMTEEIWEDEFLTIINM